MRKNVQQQNAATRAAFRERVIWFLAQADQDSRIARLVAERCGLEATAGIPCGFQFFPPGSGSLEWLTSHRRFFEVHFSYRQGALATLRRAAPQQENLTLESLSETTGNVVVNSRSAGEGKSHGWLALEVLADCLSLPGPELQLDAIRGQPTVWTLNLDSGQPCLLVTTEYGDVSVTLDGFDVGFLSRKPVTVAEIDRVIDAVVDRHQSSPGAAAAGTGLIFHHSRGLLES